MELEGHPDNAAPALLGGLVASLSPSKGQVISSKLDLAEDWRFIALIPNFRLNTSRSRQVLPDRVSFADAVSNSNRLGILLAGLGQFRADLVREGLQDRLHQPYRAALIQGFDEIGELMCAAGLIGSYLSGAGPTIMVVSSRESWQADLLKLQDLKKREPVLTGWSIQGLEVDREGAKLI